MPSSLSRASPESPAGSSRILPRIGHSETIANKSAHQQLDRNPHSIAIFSGIEQVKIGGGHFQVNQNIYNVNNHDNILKHVAFQSLPCSRDAAFCAAINLDNLTRRPCTKGTRVDIITQIMTWVEESNPTRAPPVYWLTGLAGLGKTTIAYTICQLLDEASVPFASFFCSRQLDSKDPKLLVTTLCRDLAELYDSYAANVLSILETNSKVVNARLRIQINELLVKPWQASMAQRTDRNLPTPIVVVDALDENDRGTEFLEELLDVIRAGQLVGIKFLVTSRLDPKIVGICKSFPPNAICKLHEVDTADVQNDIKKYLREALPELKDEPELSLLSQRAGGLFIYATTAVRFISPAHSPPSISEMRSHLQAMLNPETLTSYGDYDERLLVDELYERILGDAFMDGRVRARRLQILHTIVCAESSIDMPVLAKLTNTGQDTVKRVVESLHAVVFVSPKDNCVYWYHASFPDFIFSRTRARISISLRRDFRTHQVIDVSCDAAAHHGVIARQCFSIMEECLYFNMCDLSSSYVFDCDVPGLDASIDKTFSPTLRYVSRHWARHFLQALSGTEDLLKDFLCDTLLFWIEAMNLIGAKYECSSMLKDVESWAERGKDRPDLLAELTDAANFSSFFAASPASKSTPHLYISALSMWNQDSAIWRNWKDRFRFIPTISLPNGTVAIPLLTIRTTAPVRSVAFSPDGNRIVGSDDTSVGVWDVNTGEQSKELQGHIRPVSSVQFSPDGNQIVSGSYDDSIRVWDAKTGEQLRELQGHTRMVTSVAFSPDGNQIVSGSWDQSVRVWDAKTGEQVKELHGPTEVSSVAFSPDGNRIVSGFWFDSWWVWCSKTGKRLKGLRRHISIVRSVAFSHDGNRIVSGSEDKSVRVWDAKTGNQLRVLRGHTNGVSSVAFSPGGDQIVSGSVDRSVRVWDTTTGQQLMELQGHTNGVSAVAFSPDGNLIVSSSFDKSVRMWNAKMGKQWREQQGHTDAVRSVAFSPDGDRIVSSSKNESLREWDTKTGELLRKLQGPTDGFSVTFSLDGNHMVLFSQDRSVQVRDTQTGKQVKLQGQTRQVWDPFVFSPDGSRIVSRSQDNLVQVWDTKTGEQLRALRGHTSHIWSATFSPDGKQIVSGSSDKSVRVWDANIGKQLRVLRGHTNNVQSVAFSPGGNRIVSGSEDKSVRVWDTKTGEQLRELRGHIKTIWSVQFSPDSNRIVSGSDDKSVRVWDVNTGEQMMELQGHTASVRSVAFSPGGDRIVSGSEDNSVRVWNVKAGGQLRELQRYTDGAESAILSPDCKRILSGTQDSNVNLDSWVVKEDGWIISGAERLVWVPSTISNILLRPNNILIISRNGSATISFAQCKLGTLWHECYTP